MNLVPPLRVLEDKAKVITDALLERKLVFDTEYKPTYLMVLEILRSGGKFRLLEDATPPRYGHVIQVNTIYRPGPEVVRPPTVSARDPSDCEEQR